MDLQDWSEDTYTIKDVVDKLGLPNLILVSEGFLSEDDGDLSFGSGDIIQLNFVKQIPHFIAIPLENKTEMCYGNEILIPVGYRGNVQIVEDIGKVYDSVQGLVDGRPRFVRTESTVACIDINNSEVVLPAGVTLELKQDITGKTVMCKHGENNFTIDAHQSGHFSLLPDNTEYLLADMVSRLPVTIKFVNSVSELHACDLEACVEQIKTFYGVYRLVRVTCEDYIVGFYRESSELQTKCFAQTLGTVALLPLENPTVQQLEVHVSLAKQTSVETDTHVMCNHYENIYSNEETVSFMESQKEEDVTDSEDELKPSVPPRTYRRLQSFSSRNEDIEQNSLELISMDEVVTSNEEETIQTAISPDSLSNYKISDNCEHDIYSSITESQEQAETHDVDDGYCMLKDILPLTGREPSPAPDDTNNVSYSTVGPEQHTANEEPVVTICDTTEDGYSIVKFESRESNQENLVGDTKEEEPGLTKSLSDPSLNTDGPKQRKRDASKRKTFKRSMKEKMEKLSSKLSKIHIKREDSTEDDRLHRQNSEPLSPTLIKEDFHYMSVSDVAQCFRLSELPTMATICEKEELDGQFFVGLTIGYLTKAFDLSNIDALKVQKLSKGWRPQNDIEDDESFTSF